MKATNEFPRILSGFLLDELPVVQNQSGNTTTSCRDACKRLLCHMQGEARINARNVRISGLSNGRIIEFLNWLERECGNSISARNQRLAAIHSLFRHIQVQAPEYMLQRRQALAMPFKKAEKKQVGFLSEDETKALLAMPDAATRKGRRGQALLRLLYDSGARVQELADLRVGDLRLDSPSQAKLAGKGRKTRSAPMMDKAVALLGQYLREQRLDNPPCYEHPLFFNTQRKKLTRQGIAHVLKKYADGRGILDISPHRIRHAKAMRLAEADINPIFIRDFLGRTDLKAAEVYSKTSVKMKRAALEKMNSGKHDVVPDKVGDWTEDESLMDWLAGLKRH
jgi:site-specific recombinase XerD